MYVSTTAEVNQYVTSPLQSLFAKKSATAYYSFEDFTPEWYAVVRSDIFLGWNSSKKEVQELSRKNFVRQPTTSEFIMFKTKYETWKKKNLEGAHSVEAAAMQAKRVMSWTGTILTAGEESYQTVPIVHTPQVSLPKSDEYALSVATMLMKDEKGTIVPSMNPAVVEKGPLNVLMTGESYLDYTASASRILADVGAKGKGDQFQRTAYAGMAEAPASTRVALRFLTYRLFTKANIQVRAMTQQIAWVDKYVTFTAEKGMDRIVQEVVPGRREQTLVPKLLPGVLKGIVLAIDTPKRDKYPSAQMADFITSHFPANLIKYYGLRMACDRGQRQFLAIRPYLGGAVLVNPPVVLRKWVEANDLGQYIRTESTAFIEGTLCDTDVQIRFHDYVKGDKLATIVNDDGTVVTKNVLLFGRVALDREFFSQFKIVCYQPSPQGVWMYCPAGMKVELPEKYGSLKLKVINNGLEMLTVLTGLVKSLTASVFAGNYSPLGDQYVDLKYPIDQKEFAALDMTDVVCGEQATRYEGTVISESVINYDDEGNVAATVVVNEGKSKVGTLPPMPNLLPPTDDQRDSAVLSEVTTDWPGFNVISEYDSDFRFLAEGQGARVDSEEPSYMYAGIVYVVIYWTEGGSIVVPSPIFKVMQTRAMLEDQ